MLGHVKSRMKPINLAKLCKFSQWGGVCLKCVWFCHWDVYQSWSCTAVREFLPWQRILNKLFQCVNNEKTEMSQFDSEKEWKVMLNEWWQSKDVINLIAIAQCVINVTERNRSSNYFTVEGVDLYTKIFRGFPLYMLSNLKLKEKLNLQSNLKCD